MIEGGPLLELDIQLEFQDYLRFQYYEGFRALWWAVPLFALAATVSFVLVAISAYYQDSYLLRDITPFSSLVFLGGIFLFAGPYLTAKREFAVNSTLSQVIHYRFLESTLETISPQRAGKLSWRRVKEVRETGTAFLIYSAAAGAFVLPKRQFPTSAEISAFREVLLVILGAEKCKFTLDRISRRF